MKQAFDNRVIPLGEPATTKAKLVGIAMALFAAFGGFLYGYDTGYISGTKEMPYWCVHRPPLLKYCLIRQIDVSLTTSGHDSLENRPPTGNMP